MIHDPPPTLPDMQMRSQTGGRLQSFGHAIAGIGFVARNEPNMQVHLAAAVAVIGAGLGIGLNLPEWRWLIIAIALVLMAETLNTAVEQACNAVSQTFDPAIKAAKDAAAGAVLIIAILAALIGVSVFLPHLTQSPTSSCQGAGRCASC